MQNITTYTTKHFKSGEVEISLVHSSALLYYKCSSNINSSLFELLLMIAKLRAEINKPISLILPYLPYSRCDESSLQELYNIFAALGIKRVFAAEIHSQINKSSVEVINLEIASEIVEKIDVKNKNIVVISPDQGGHDRAMRVANDFGWKYASMKKHRRNNCIEHFFQDHKLVEGKSVLILDDIIDSGATIASAATLLRNSGAASIDVLGIHGVFSSPTELTQINQAYTTNTICSNNLSSEYKVIDADEIIRSKVNTWFNKG
jgi:ribose-phosphate pyrophosphokinase